MDKTKKGNRFTGNTVEVRNDDFNRAMRNFWKKVQESGLLKELKDRTSYEKPAVAKQRLKKQARKRWERDVEQMISQGLWHRDKNYWLYILNIIKYYLLLI